MGSPLNVRTLLLALLIAVWVAACGTRMDEPRVGLYRGTLETPGGEAPFGLEIAREQGQYVLYLSNGDERTRLSDVRLEDRELVVPLPGDPNASDRRTLKARLYRNGLEGQLSVIQSDGTQQHIPFKASFGDVYRFYARPATDNADVSGRWSLMFTNDAGRSTPAVVVLEQAHDRVTGSIEIPSGDRQPLEGQVRGDDLRLSSFSRGMAHLYRLKVNDAGNLEGDYWQDLQRHERIDAHRDPDATLEELKAQAMQPGAPGATDIGTTGMSATGIYN